MVPTRSIPLVLGLGAVLGALGCNPTLDSVTIAEVTTPPMTVTVSGTGIQIPEGIAVAVDIVGKNSDGDDVHDMSLMLEGDSLGADSVDNQDRYILHGDTVGTGQLQFTAVSNEGTVSVPYTVVAQP